MNDQKRKKCDVFSPKEIAVKMNGFLTQTGTLLEPAVGTGSLLLDLSNYDRVDVFDVEAKYLANIQGVNKFQTDFLKHDFGDAKYDNILMNPPYSRIQDIEKSYRKFLKEKFNLKGSFDLYLAFLIKCVGLLAPDGVLVSINPRSWLTNGNSFKTFRENVFEKKIVHTIIDYGSKKIFADADTYCTITVLRNSPQMFYTLNGTRKLHFHSNIRDPCPFQVSVGLATNCNQVFLHKKRLFDEPCWRIVFKVSKNIELFGIFPYNDSKLMSEEEFKEQNPQTYQFMLGHKEKLLARDRGNFKSHWYAFGRGQGLHLPEGDVVYVSGMSQRPFTYITKQAQHFINGLVLYGANACDIIKWCRDHEDDIASRAPMCAGDTYRLSRSCF